MFCAPNEDLKSLLDMGCIGIQRIVWTLRYPMPICLIVYQGIGDSSKVRFNQIWYTPLIWCSFVCSLIYLLSEFTICVRRVWKSTWPTVICCTLVARFNCDMAIMEQGQEDGSTMPVDWGGGNCAWTLPYTAQLQKTWSLLTDSAQSRRSPCQSNPVRGSLRSRIAHLHAVHWGQTFEAITRECTKLPVFAFLAAIIWVRLQKMPRRHLQLKSSPPNCWE